ncbi:MAG: hypothetical protein ACTSRC_21925 [Candidatus Helarchaeota archaeon]
MEVDAIKINFLYKQASYNIKLAKDEREKAYWEGFRDMAKHVLDYYQTDLKASFKKSKENKKRY